jgi:nanoRNase/pAp phosphatase (c-di-AMP/oligoRNAs hydrolase)
MPKQFRDVNCLEKQSAMPHSGADPGVNGRSYALSRRSDRFLGGLADFRRVTFISHVHPDPDSLGSMLGLAYLVESCVGKPTRMTRDGLIGRAENRMLVDVMGLELTPIEDVEWQADDAVVMVDSQPRTGRHNIHRGIPLYAVIDHHQTPGDVANVPFLDIRRSIGATCSLVTRYLMEQELELPGRVATCLFYGIETELTGYPREASSLDESALHFLYPLVDKDAIAKIRNAPLPESFYETLLQALQSSFIYDELLISWINDLPAPELCSQSVDFLIRHEGIRWALCAGVHENQMILSLRANRPRAQAGEILRAVAAKMGGRAGGHDRRAGGQIPLQSTSASAIDQVQSEFRRRLLKALQIEEQRGRRLVPVREMLQNMQ